MDTSRREAESDGVHVPTTLQEYCQQHKPVDSVSSFPDLEDDMYDDNYYQDSSEEDVDMNSESGGSNVEEDSGTA